MVADYACIIKDNNSRGDPSSQGEQGNYLFVVTPVEEDGSNSESWSGQLTVLKNTFAKGNEKVEQSFNSRFD